MARKEIGVSSVLQVRLVHKDSPVFLGDQVRLDPQVQTGTQVTVVTEVLRV